LGYFYTPEEAALAVAKFSVGTKSPSSRGYKSTAEALAAADSEGLRLVERADGTGYLYIRRTHAGGGWAIQKVRGNAPYVRSSISSNP
jgi:hypothetical protein